MDMEIFSQIEVDFKWTPEQEIEMVRKFCSENFHEASCTWLEKTTHETLQDDVYRLILNEITLRALQEHIKSQEQSE